MGELEQVKKEIAEIKARNKRVELDKAWETSLTRKLALVAVTYIAVAVVFWSLEISRPFTNAIIPTVAFFISTLTLTFLKKHWIKDK